MKANHTYTFDVKLFAQLKIEAPNLKAAKKRLEQLLDCASADFGADEDGNPLETSIILDTEDGGELTEIDGRGAYES